MSAVKKIHPDDDMMATILADLPTSKSERYKYTNLAAALKGKRFDAVAAQWNTKGDTQYATLYDDDASLPAWVKEAMNAQPAGQTFYKDMTVWAAANASAQNRLVVDVPKNTKTDTLVLSIGGAKNAYAAPYLLVRVAEGAECTIIEHHDAHDTAWNNGLTQIIVEKNARLRHYRVQSNGTDAVYTQNTHVVQHRDSTYEACVLTTGSSLSRNQIHVDLQGEGAAVYLSGLNLLVGTQHADTTITIEHQAPNCHSNQLYKTIVDDKAHCVFQGKVHVHQIAQKTDGYQLSNALILSPTAVMDTKPELEIYADDVKCSHGSTTGQIDTAPLFYLRTRGLSEAQARMLLMQAFLGPVIDNIRDENVREQFGQLSFDWLSMQTSK